MRVRVSVHALAGIGGVGADRCGENRVFISTTKVSKLLGMNLRVIEFEKQQENYIKY